MKPLRRKREQRAQRFERVPRRRDRASRERERVDRRRGRFAIGQPTADRALQEQQVELDAVPDQHASFDVVEKRRECFDRRRCTQLFIPRNAVQRLGGWPADHCGFHHGSALIDHVVCSANDGRDLDDLVAFGVEAGHF